MMRMFGTGRPSIREALFALGDQPQRRYLHKCQDLDVVVFARAAVAHGL